MANVGHELMIRYGLSRAATPSESDRWVALTQQLIRQGVGRDEAGRRAADLILPGVGTRFYASESDTIEMLLRKANQ